MPACPPALTAADTPGPRWPRLALLMAVAAAVTLSGCAGLRAGAQAGSSEASAGAAAQAAREAQRQTLANALEGASVSVLLMPDGQLQLNVPSDFSFTLDKADIRAEGRPVLDKIATQLQAPAFVAMRVRVVGHTDSQGGAALNETLSLARAQSVQRYLESHGVAASRLQALGMGEREPIAPNDKPYGRTLNRRIEIYLKDAAAP